MIKGDRRATPRIEVMDQLHGRLVSLNVTLVVRELGAGGFSIESPVAFPPNARHQFRFSTPGGVEVILEATVVHSRPSIAADGKRSCITGFAFCHDSAHDAARAVDDLLGALTPTLEFR